MVAFLIDETLAFCCKRVRKALAHQKRRLVVGTGCGSF